MVKINSIGVGQKSSGTLDGITYVTRKGMTYARAAFKMPASAYNTPAAKKRQAIFKMVQMHIQYHLRTIKQTFTPKENGSAYNCYYHTNKKAFAKALDSLAEQYVSGMDVTITDIEQAISKYAEEHPTSIKIAKKPGHQVVFLTGAWPDTITLRGSGNDSTTIIIVAENGSQTVIKPNGSTSVENGGSTSSGSDSNNSGGTQSGDNSGSNNEQGDDNGGGDKPNL